MSRNLRQRLSHVEDCLGTLNRLAEGVILREHLDRENAYVFAHLYDGLVTRVVALADSYARVATCGNDDGKGTGPHIYEMRSLEQIAVEFEQATKALDEAVNTWHAMAH